MTDDQPFDPVAAACHEVSDVMMLPYGLVRTQLAERIARRIENQGPEGALPYARVGLIEAYYWGGEVEKTFVPFQQQLRLLDERPDLFDEGELHFIYWVYKWVVSSAFSYPQVDATQIDSLIADMERRYRLAGNGLDAVYDARYLWAQHRGLPETEALMQEWIRHPADEMSDCRACSISEEIEFYGNAGRWHDALACYDRHRDEDLSCATEPANMLSVMALVYAEVGRTDDAVSAHRVAQSALARSQSSMGAARGRGIELLARGNQPERAIAELEENAELFHKADTPLVRLRFLTRVLGGLSAMTSVEIDRVVAVPRVPAATVGELRRWVDDEASGLAAQFDQRNGTDRFATLLVAARATHPFDATLDFSVVDIAAIDTDELDTAETKSTETKSTETKSTETKSTETDSTVTASDADTVPTQMPHDEGRERPETTDGEAASSEDAPTSAAQIVRHLIDNARSAERDGDLITAGRHLAAAAVSAKGVGDLIGAGRLFTDALDRLEAADASAEDRIQVLFEWAPIATNPEAASRVVSSLRAVLEPAEKVNLDKLTGALRERLERELAATTAHSKDLIARVVATVPGTDNMSIADAMSLADEAADTYARLGDPGQAAHAFWLTGRLAKEQGDAQMVDWGYESAIEGFDRAHDAEHRSDAASEYIAYLRDTGQEARVDFIVDTMTSNTMTSN